MTSPLRRSALLGWVIVLFVLILAACSSSAPPIARSATVAPVPTGSRQLLPQISSGKQASFTPARRPSSTQTSERSPETTAQPAPEATVWNPRDIAARVQVALARVLDTTPKEVPWVNYVRQADPKHLKCLDRLVGDVPLFGEGEALVFKHKGVPIYVVSSRGALWVCRSGSLKVAGVTMSLEVARQEAISNLARRLGVDGGQVQVLTAKKVTWPDASLGCPEPGKTYAQVLTPGYLIVLRARDTRYEYHGNAQTLFLCGNAQPSTKKK